MVKTIPIQHPINPTKVAMIPITNNPNMTTGCLETIKILAWIASTAFRLPKIISGIVISVNKVTSTVIKNPTIALIFKLNPMTGIIEMFRYAVLGSGTFNIDLLIYTSVVTFIVLFVGVAIFNKVEKNFIDSI